MTVSYALVLLVAAVVCSGYGGDEASCLRFGGGSCCPLLNALNRKLSEVRIVNVVFFFVASLILFYFTRLHGARACAKRTVKQSNGASAQIRYLIRMNMTD